MSSFTFDPRRQPVACAANIPLLMSLVRLCESAAADAAVAASSAAPSGGGSNGRPKSVMIHQVYGKAIISIAKYPLEITSAAEAEQLQGIGNFLAARIGRILKEIRGAAPSASASPPVSSHASLAAAAAAAAPGPASKPAKKPRATQARSHSDISAVSSAASSSIAAAASVPILPLLPSIFSPDTLRAAAGIQPARAPSDAASTKKVECPFGVLCYRTNPSHFSEQSHPPTHPLAAALAESTAAASSAHSASRPSQTISKRSHDEIIILSDCESDSSEPPVSVKKRKSDVVLSSFVDDFLTDDEEDLVDLTTPPPPMTSHNRRASAMTIADTDRDKPPLSRPPLPRPAAAAASSGWSLPPPPPAAAAAASAKSKTEKQYRPKVGSSAHVLLVTLAHASSPLSKPHLLAAALPHAPEEKRSLPDATTWLWSGMVTLLTKDLVHKALTPVQYSLTSAGRSTVQPLVALPATTQMQLTSPPDSFLSSSSPPPTATQVASRSPDVQPPVRASSNVIAAPPIADLVKRFCRAEDFDVVLLIDVRERSGRKDAADMIDQLSKVGARCEARALSVGDFMWIARHKTHSSIEVVLDTLIERKRVSDLVSSIRDGRYHEQRSRLKKTNLRRIIYVIEGRIAEDTVFGLPVNTVENVLAAVTGVHGLLVHHTPSIEFTISFLLSLHHLLEEEVLQEGVPVVLPKDAPHQPLASNQTLPRLTEPPSFASPSSAPSPASAGSSPPSRPHLFGAGESFASFGHRLHKSAHLLAAELFGTQLRMIRGVSAAAAMQVIEAFPSARALLDAYQKCDSQEAEEAMLENLQRGVGGSAAPQHPCIASSNREGRIATPSQVHVTLAHHFFRMWMLLPSFSLSPSISRPLGKALSLKIRTFFRADYA